VHVCTLSIAQTENHHENINSSSHGTIEVPKTKNVRSKQNAHITANKNILSVLTKWDSIGVLACLVVLVCASQVTLHHALEILAEPGVGVVLQHDAG